MYPPIVAGPYEPFEENIKAQNFLSKIRFLGYAGVQFNALLVPLLVFSITGSLSMAGLALLVEWLPKLGFYITSGAFIQKFSSVKVHLSLDFARLLAFIVLALCAFINFGPLSVWAVALSAAVYQCSNALSNVLFEQSVTRLWAPPRRANGHAHLLQQDQYASFSALIVGLLVGSVAFLSLIALIIQLSNFLLVWRVKNLIYQTNSNSNNNFLLTKTTPSYAPPPNNSFLTQLKKDAQCILKLQFLKFSSMALMISVPSAFIFSCLPFFLEKSQVGAGESSSLLSFLLLSKTFLSILSLYFIRKKLQSERVSQIFACTGLCFIVLSATLLSFTIPLWLMFSMVCLLGITGGLYIPWIRSLRQELVVALIPEPSRSGATGLLIAVDAASYLLAALLLTFLGSNLTLATLIASFISFCGLIMASNFYFKKR